jgi:hypothetical protein
LIIRLLLIATVFSGKPDYTIETMKQNADTQKGRAPELAVLKSAPGLMGYGEAGHLPALF